MLVDDEHLSDAFRKLVITFHQMKHNPGTPKASYQGRWRILTNLQKQGDVSQRELAELVMMKPGSLTEALEHLEDEGLVVRKRDSQDRRIVRVSITDQGRRAQRKMNDHARRFESNLFACLNDTDRLQLMQILNKLTNQLQLMKEKCGNG